VSTPPAIAISWPKTDYCLSLEAAGARPLILCPDRQYPDRALLDADGLLLTGGADVDPASYGATVRHPTVTVTAGRDAYELALTRDAIARGTPILAICRGIQVLNVAAGGTLVQDLPSDRPSTVPHRVKEPETALAHTVTITPLTRLATLLAEQSRKPVPVNSRHHQAIDRLASEFVVSAVAPDGVIEAIERPDRAFCLGVQWHPENFWATGRFAELFSAFVDAARRFAAQRQDATTPR
jgi:putative glutamine amidotransferase